MAGGKWESPSGGNVGGGAENETSIPIPPEVGGGAPPPPKKKGFLCFGKGAKPAKHLVNKGTVYAILNINTNLM
jgi:hypothetical protein